MVLVCKPYFPPGQRQNSASNCRNNILIIVKKTHEVKAEPRGHTMPSLTSWAQNLKLKQA